MRNNQSSFKNAYVRYLKVYTKILIRLNPFHERSAKDYPEIRLMGKWLKDAGFKPGQQVRIIVEYNKLTITHGIHPAESPALSGIPFLVAKTG